VAPSRQRTLDPGRLGERIDATPGVARLRAAAGEAPVYLVGGSVRDALLGLPSANLDLAVEGDGIELAKRLGGELIRTHPQFGTAVIEIDGLVIDVATARTESYPAPGALPEVEPASIEDDLARRDFTINAMAVPLSGEPALIDPHGGLADLEQGLLRVLHDRSFVDDPTRALRAARYAARLGLRLESGTEQLLRAADLSTAGSYRLDRELARLDAELTAPRARELLEEWELADAVA